MTEEKAEKKEKKKTQDRLITVKQDLFCREYITNGGDASAAYQKIYSAKASYATTHGNASKMLKKPYIRAYLQKLREPLQKKLEYTARDCFNKLCEIQQLALSKKKQMFVDGEIIETVDDKDLANALKAEEMKGKLLGLFKDTTVNIQNDIDTTVNINFIKKIKK